MDNWLPAHRAADGDNGPYVMGYYTREDIPFQFALARVVHRLRQLLLLGPGPDLAEPALPDERHHRPGAAPRAARSSATRDPTLYALEDLSGGADRRRRRPGRSTRRSTTTAATCWSTSRPSRTPRRAPPLYQNGMRTYSAGQFEYDAAHDRLPTVSWIIPTSYQSEHPDYTAGRRRRLRGQQDRRHRVQPGRVEEDASSSSTTTRTTACSTTCRRPVPPAGHRGRVRGRPADRRRVPRARASSSRRGRWAAGWRATVRPHLHAALARAADRRGRSRTSAPGAAPTFGDLTSALGVASRAHPPQLPDTKQRLEEAVERDRDAARADVPRRGPEHAESSSTAPVRGPGPAREPRNRSTDRRIHHVPRHFRLRGLRRGARLERADGPAGRRARRRSRSRAHAAAGESR